MDTRGLTRRRAITIIATSIAGLASGRSVMDHTFVDYEWRGFAMGTDARIVFSGVENDSARMVAAMVSVEIERLESALSLFRDDSEIARLNRDKVLPEPTGDMRRALGLALEIAATTEGLFDPTVQALWEAYANWFAASPGADIPSQAMISEALGAVDWRRIKLTHNSIYLGDNQRVTLNGLGQGYVTDRIADLLRSHGFNHVLVDLGEQRAIGPRRDGAPWLIERQGTDGIDLTEGALATSEGSGCVLGGAGAFHHLFDPRTGRSPSQWQRVTVHHRSAAIADGLSTALYAAAAHELPDILERFGDIAVWTTDRDGGEQHWTSPFVAHEKA
ncbi:MAG: FAD:protein FMN transferase [Pseudolabrys sp.]|nr:FAD:protein FMN transferase [Pseudolabrys sp.]MDP2298429.1 FAD:protein FMN transferase [Pseudolabrys sp.]